jgi:DNA helicase HerA-like ATPase
LGISGVFIDFFLNINRYIPHQLPSQPSDTILIFVTQLILFISLGILLLGVQYKPKDLIELESPTILRSRKGTIGIGTIINQKGRDHKFYLSLSDLEKHMFVCGATGTGKSNFVQNFLIKLREKHDIPFLLVEFKGEYIFLQNKIDDMLVLRPGENFSLNIFNPEGTNPEIHAERIFDILKSGQFLDDTAEYSPQMQKVLVDILTEVCKNREYRNWKGFYMKCTEYLKKKKKSIPMLAQTLISIKNRIRRFSVGPLKEIFEMNKAIKVRELFHTNILMDLSSIIRLGGEKEDALFFLNMILKYLWDTNLTEGGKNYEGIKHITIVEDAQYFAPQELVKQTKLTTYLEDIALLQRGTGECLISIATRPTVSEDILANCGILVVFKTHMQGGLQCELLNLSEENRDYLSMLETGTCIIRVNSIKRPFLLRSPHSPRKSLTNSQISRNNRTIFHSKSIE